MRRFEIVCHKASLRRLQATEKFRGGGLEERLALAGRVHRRWQIDGRGDAARVLAGPAQWVAVLLLEPLPRPVPVNYPARLSPGTLHITPWNGHSWSRALNAPSSQPTWPSYAKGLQNSIERPTLLDV